MRNEFENKGTELAKRGGSDKDEHAVNRDIEISRRRRPSHSTSKASFHQNVFQKDGQNSFGRNGLTVHLGSG